MRSERPSDPPGDGAGESAGDAPTRASAARDGTRRHDKTNAAPAHERLNRGGIAEIWEAIRRAYDDFLVLPSWIVLAFVLLAVGLHLLDLANPGALRPVHDFLISRYFTKASVAQSLFSTLTGAMISAESITFTLLLIAVQQAAAPLGFQVFDQFLRRALNQVYFGYFVGLAVYTLLLLPTANGQLNPVYGATVEVLLIAVALLLLLLMVYSTIDQTRPVAIIEAIHQHALLARRHQLTWLAGVRSRPECDGPVRWLVRAPADGFVTRLHLDAIMRAVSPEAPDAHDIHGVPDTRKRREVEIVLKVQLGSFVAFDDVVAEVRAYDEEDARAVDAAVRRAVELERQRDIDVDPGFGVEQVGMIGWTSISTAKSNPGVGLVAVDSMRDLLSRWTALSWGIHADDQENQENHDDHGGARTQAKLPIVYYDQLYQQIIDSLESMGVAASESL